MQAESRWSWQIRLPLFDARLNGEIREYSYNIRTVYGNERSVNHVLTTSADCHVCAPAD